MKIKKLWVSKFKNFENKWFEFDEKLTTLLVGQNGLGKSNLIEIITHVFRLLDLASNKSDLISNENGKLFDFEILYSVQKSDISIRVKDSNLDIGVKDIGSDEEFNMLSFTEFNRRKKEEFLPDFLLVYYSGENKRIRSQFKIHNDRRNRVLRSGDSANYPVLGRLFYTEQNFGELIFLVLWIFKNTPKYNSLINELLEKFISIDSFSKIELYFNQPSFFDYSSQKELSVEELNSRYDYLENLWNIRGDVGKLLEILYDNNLDNPIAYREEKKEFLIFQNLNFDTLGNSLINEFKTIAKIFDVLEAANRIGILNQIKANIVKGVTKVKHDFADLSEGEQQLLTVIGLVLLTGESDTLFLLDEPDTHLNPNWQRNYVKLLNKFNLDNTNSQIFVATHSPLIVQAAKEANIILFKKEEDSVVTDNNSHQIENWRLDQVLVSEYFGFDSARPPGLDNYMMLREQILKSYPISEENKKELEKFENEFGVLPTGETKTELETLQLMSHFIKMQDDKDKK